MSTVTIKLNSELEQKLLRLTNGTCQSRADLATEAVQTYVDHQLKIVEGIERGIEDMKNGHVVPHHEAMDEIDVLIDEIERRR